MNTAHTRNTRPRATGAFPLPRALAPARPLGGLAARPAGGADRMRLRKIS